MSANGATPLFVDTGAFYARADDSDKHHDTATRLFEAIRTGEVPYRPVYTSHFVLSELATLTLYKLGHADAVRTLRSIRDSESFTVLPVGTDLFDRTCEEFSRYDDQMISFVDHSSAVLAAEYEIGHIFAFDADFRTLGLTVVPDDVHLPETDP